MSIRSLILLAILLSGRMLNSQSIGVCAQMLAQAPYQQETTFNVNNVAYKVTPTSKFSTGFRLEGQFLFPKFVWAIGFTYFAPRTDSSVYKAKRMSTYTDEILRGTTKTKMWTIGMRCGRSIPQKWDEQLSIMIALGIQGGGFRQQNIFPENYSGGTESDFDSYVFMKYKQPYMAGEATCMVFYHLTRISLTAQYSAFLAFEEELRPFSRHGLSAGIHIALVE